MAKQIASALTRKVLVEKTNHVFYEKAKRTQYIFGEIEVFTIPIVVKGKKSKIQVGWDSEDPDGDDVCDITPEKIFVEWYGKKKVNPEEQKIFDKILKNKEKVFCELQELPL
jgi:hypothetical protein